MLPFETLTLAYFIALACAAPLSSAPSRRVVEVVVLAGAVCLWVTSAAAVAPVDVRAWIAHGYLVLGYWLPARLVSRDTEHPTRFEARLVRTDAIWRRHATALPGPVTTALELAYVLCYPAVPFAFAVAWTVGTAADVNRFWVAVLGAGFLCYGWLPWLVSRPPRAVEPVRDRRGALAAFNVGLLRRVSHQLNTFPSGHVAVAVAAALVVLPIWWPGGALLALVGLGVAGGAVAGRYHYLVDVVLGIAVGTGCALLSKLLPPAV